MSIDIYSYFMFLCFPHKKREKQNIFICFYLRGNMARINFYMLLIYLYREKKKDAKNAFSARYIELYIKKENSLPNLTGNERRETKAGKGKVYAVNAVSISKALSKSAFPLITLFIWFSL